MHNQSRNLVQAIAFCSALQLATGATLTWNRNLTEADTAYYSIYDDDNWIVDGAHAGNAPDGYTNGIYRSDSVVIPNGITARWEDPSTGGGKSRYGKNLTVGTSEPGATQISVKNNYTSGLLAFFFEYGMTGDPDNDLGDGEWHVINGGGRAVIFKGNQSGSFLHNFGISSYFEFYGTNLIGVCGSGGMSQIRTKNAVDIIAPDVWFGRLQFRDFKGTFTATNDFTVGGLNWRDATTCRAILGTGDHTIDDITFTTFDGGNAGIIMNDGSITMRDWSQNEFTDPTNFKLDTTTINMIGTTADTGIELSARGRDDGFNGFSDNFAFGRLVVGDDAGDVVTLQSPLGAYETGSESSDAALYVNTLDLSSGANLVIPSGIKIYAKTLIGSRSRVSGSERLFVLPQGTLMTIR